MKIQNEKSQGRSIAGLLVFLVICLGVGGLGGIATAPEIKGWYATLTKPSWNPPNWIFGPMWTTLFVMMAVSAWLVWKRPGIKLNSLPMILFAIQLVLNSAWSWIFFNLHMIGAAFAELCVLWVAIAVTMYIFFKHSKLAGGLMIPYLAWVTFAGCLNFAIWRLNG